MDSERVAAPAFPRRACRNGGVITPLHAPRPLWMWQHCDGRVSEQPAAVQDGSTPQRTAARVRCGNLLSVMGMADSDSRTLGSGGVCYRSWGILRVVVG